MQHFFANAFNSAIWLGTMALAFLPSLRLWQRPYVFEMVFQVAVPWIAVGMALSAPGSYSLFHGLLSKRFTAASSRTNVKCRSLAWVWSPAVLTLLLHYRYLMLPNQAPVIGWGCLAGALLFGLAALSDEELWSPALRLHVAGGFVLALVWGYAAVLQLNTVLDDSPGAVYPTVVTAKSGRTVSDLHLTIAPWRHEPEPRSVNVPVKVFLSVKPGGTVCMVMRQGALGIGWYTAQACPWKGGLVQLRPGAGL
jgi:hypothetical protein